MPLMPAPTARPDLVRAGAEEFEDVLCVLSDAAAWLRRKGIEDQWPPTFEENDHRAVKLRQELDKGNVWLARWDGHPLATVTITDWADPDFAEGWPTPTTDALYVMRLATTVAARNMGLRLGARLLEHAVLQAVQECRYRVRLDCSKRNTELHRYYEANGFRRVGTVDLPTRRSGALFEWTYRRSAPATVTAWRDAPIPAAAWRGGTTTGASTS